MYLSYNDNELIYLYKDGNEKALDILLTKYSHFIVYYIESNYPYSNKKNDLIQEGRMVLFDCINKYKEDYDVKFYSYFRISLARKFYRLLADNYYDNNLYLREGYINEIYHENMISLDHFVEENKSDLIIIIEMQLKKILDKLELDIFRECILYNLPVKKYAKIHNLKYSNIYNKYKKICEIVKTIIIDNKLLD